MQRWDLLLCQRSGSLLWGGPPPDSGWPALGSTRAAWNCRWREAGGGGPAGAPRLLLPPPHSTYPLHARALGPQEERRSRWSGRGVGGGTEHRGPPWELTCVAGGGARARKVAVQEGGQCAVRWPRSMWDQAAARQEPCPGRAASAGALLGSRRLLFTLSKSRARALLLVLAETHFFFPLAKFVVAKVSFIGLPCGPAVTGIHRWARCVQERGSG